MLAISWSTIFWEVINFLVITVALYFLAFKPMAKRAEARSLEKAAAKAKLEENVAASAEKLREIDDRLMLLNEEIQVITDQAYANSQILQKDLLDATQETADRIMKDAVYEARKEQVVEIQEHQVQLVDFLLGFANQTLLEVTPPEVHERLIDEMIKHINNLGKTDLRTVQNIRESLEGRSPVVELGLPQALSPENERRLVNTFNALTDTEVDLTITIIPDLIAGVRARIGDIVLDNTLGSQIENMRDEITSSLETLLVENND